MELPVENRIGDENDGWRLAKDLAGAHGLLADTGPLGTSPEFPKTQAVVEGWHGWHGGYLFSPALTIGGGTSEVQRNIIAERVLGLPHDVDVESGKSWAEARATLA